MTCTTAHHLIKLLYTPQSAVVCTVQGMWAVNQRLHSTANQDGKHPIIKYIGPNTTYKLTFVHRVCKVHVLNAYN